MGGSPPIGVGGRGPLEWQVVPALDIWRELDQVCSAESLSL